MTEREPPDAGGSKPDRPGGRTVVLVHGLWYGTVSLALLARRLEARGFRTHAFSYPTLGRTLAENARALYEFARRIDAKPLDFVGHSLGGLVILRMFDGWRRLPEGRVVLMGSPVRGSSTASKIAQMPLTRPFVGKARTALAYGFGHAPAGRETGVIAGTKGLGLGRVFKRLELPHDGTIAVAETELPDAADRLELDVSHTGLVLSAEVASQVARFLHRGRFDRGAGM